MLDLSFLSGWRDYPIAEFFHGAQGVLAGWLGTRAIFKKEPSDALIALWIMLAFGIYEGYEMARIHDHGDQDFQNFLLFAMTTGIIYMIIHLYRKWEINSKFNFWRRRKMK